ncbi:sorbosone dehydrogenase family protein [Candidatus Woesearchaeota archaeon]|nr:sorbosone dehydrogenase family protein [Candidatus Woesearchaeota archaeon]
MSKKWLTIVVILILLGLAWPFLQQLAGFHPAPLVTGELSQITLPQGFHINYYAKEVHNARSMALSETGILYVGSRSEGKVYAVVDQDGDYQADRVITIAEHLNSPNGVALRQGDLYIAEISRILRIDNIDKVYDRSPNYTVVNDHFPTDAWHGWKFIRFGPDDKLYVPIGAPCNACEPGDPYASIMRMNPNGTALEIFARGIRNTVGFDWHPITDELWFTDNGRDWWGENRPPDELNNAPQQGMHFGYPYCHGMGAVDDEFNKEGNCQQYTTPEQALGPHVAALGMRFYTGSQFPKQYQNGIFIAEHGSWNRKVPIGYRVTFVALNATGPTSYEPFAQGWLHNDSASGRPVDVQQMTDGSLLVSDDAADAIYRIWYEP